MARIRSIPRVVRGGVGQRRKSLWIPFLPVTTDLGPATAILQFVLSAGALALAPFTIVRSRFLLHIASDQEAADELAAGAFGIAVVSDTATGIGVTAVPTPITDAGSSLFFVHQYMYARLQFASASGFDGDSGHVYEVDSKAMRKFELGNQVAVVIENAGASNDTIRVVTAGRMLIKTN